MYYILSFIKCWFVDLFSFLDYYQYYNILRIQMTFDILICFVRYVWRIWIDGLYTCILSIFKFLRNPPQTAFHNGCANLHSDQHFAGFPFFHICASTSFLSENSNSNWNEWTSHCSIDFSVNVDISLF